MPLDPQLAPITTTPSAAFPSVVKVSDGEEASAVVFNRPTEQLISRTTTARDKIDALIAGLNTAMQPFPVTTLAPGTNSAVTENIYLANPTGSGAGAVVDVILPTPVAKAIVIVKDITGNVGANKTTVKRVVSGTSTIKIDGVAEDYVLRTNHEAVTFVSDGTDWFLIKSGGGGSGAGATPVTFLDASSTVLPSGTYNTVSPIIIDGVTAVENDTILFTKLAAGNNKVYKITGITNNGDTITLQPEFIFNGESPFNGAAVRVLKGVGFTSQLAVFNGTVWNVNDTIRMFNGADYWEASSLRTVTITDNSTATIFEVTAAGSENIHMHYAIKRGSSKDSGILMITHNGSTVQVARSSAGNTDAGVTFNASLVAGSPQKLKLSYTTTTTGAGGGLKYYMSRWSDDPGGPGGIPDYSNATIPSGVAAAAGASGNIQFNDGGSALGADTKFNWNKATGELELNGLKISALSNSVTLNDNTGVATNLVQFPSSESTHFVIEYSVTRGSVFRTGRMLVASNGTTVGFDDAFVETSLIGAVFSAAVDGTNVALKYTLSSTGTNAVFKYSVRRWI